MSVALEFEPFVPYWLLYAAAGIALLFTAAALIMRVRGAVIRSLAVIALALCIANPIIVREEREPLPDVAVLLTDRSESLSVDGRQEEAEQAADRIRASIVADPSLELVEAEIPPGEDGTRLFEALSRALGEAPRDRLAGVFVVTDGQAHDAPENPDALDLGAPMHAVVIGDPDAADRRLEIVEASEYGIVGERTAFAIRVDDPRAPAGSTAAVTLTLDGGEPFQATVVIGEDSRVEFEIPHRGPNVVEIIAEPGEQELTLANNRAALSVTGVRDRLRVLLVTGAPHQGARDWRNLLKSDPTVDLVHFTILRPLSKNNNTAIGELSLIEFPTRQLFVDRLEEFDLVIFDRYEQDEQVLPAAYLDNVSRYVEAGGAFLINVGPPFAGENSLSRSLLSSILPARPTGTVLEQSFRPRISEIGQKHPVTRGLTPAEGEQQWGPWFRMVEAQTLSGQALMEGPSGQPLMLLDRVGEGRVALMLSDQAWLWARGYQGGGPHVEMFRRLSHWLMKEPELEEERLTADIQAGAVTARMVTMADEAPPGVMRSPTGVETPLTFRPTGPGMFEAEAQADETGLYQFTAGDLTAIAASGPLNPKEFSDLRATAEIVRPAVDASGGGAFIERQTGLPQIRRVRPGNETAGRDWAGLIRNERTVTRERLTTPAAPALLLCAIVLALFGGAWRREGA
jgi:hypothetical protein